MQYVHLERFNPLTRREFADGAAAPEAHIYVNPAAVAKIQGHTKDTSVIVYRSDDAPDTVIGYAPDIARMFEESNLEVVEALNDIESTLGEIQIAIEGIDCG